MTIPIFPSLVGQGWSVHKKPRFDTRIAAHATGREARARKYARPLWDFELTFDGLDATATGTYGALGAQSFQALAGFYLSVQGRYAPFLYQDPSDSVAGQQVIGVGDGSTRAFTFIRSIGEYTFPVDVVTTITGIYFDGVSQSAGWGMIGPNVVRFDIAPAANVVITSTFTYAYGCRFSDDVEDFEEFGVMLMDAKTIRFQAIRDPLPILAKQKIVIFLFGSGNWVVPPDFTTNNMIEGWGGGGGSNPQSSAYAPGAAGGGGAYAYAQGVNLTPGAVIPYTAGAGGAAVGAGGGTGSPGGTTFFGPSGGSWYIQAAGGGYLWFGFYGGQVALPHGYNGGSASIDFGIFGSPAPYGNKGGGGAGGPGGVGGTGGDTPPLVNPQFGPWAGSGGGGASGGGNGGDVALGSSSGITIPGAGGFAGSLGGGKGGDGAPQSGGPGQPGSAGAERFSTAGQVGGGGGGGGGGSDTGQGGAGGGWGGGAGGGLTANRGADGAIVITYTKN